MQVQAVVLPVEYLILKVCLVEDVEAVVAGFGEVAGADAGYDGDIVGSRHSAGLLDGAKLRFNLFRLIYKISHA